MGDRYWIDGTGDWNDPAHWALSTKGAGGASPPGAGDNAIIDYNSGGYSGYTIYINDTILCTIAPITGPNVTLEVNSGITFSLPNAITGLHALRVYGSLITNNYNINLVAGIEVFNTGAFDAGTSQITIARGASGDVLVDVHYDANTVFDNAIFKITGGLADSSKVYFYAGGHTYGDVNVTHTNGKYKAFIIDSVDNDYSWDHTNCIIKNLSVAGDGFFITSKGAEITILNKLELDGENPGGLLIASYWPMITFAKQSGTISVSNCTLEWIEVSGGASFYALLTNGNINRGGNTGWIFTDTTRNRYLVQEGGSTNFLDPNNWSFTSGGPGGAPPPGARDVAIIDEYSLQWYVWFLLDNQSVNTTIVVTDHMCLGYFGMRIGENSSLTLAGDSTLGELVVAPTGTLNLNRKTLSVNYLAFEHTSAAYTWRFLGEQGTIKIQGSNLTMQGYYSWAPYVKVLIEVSNKVQVEAFKWTNFIFENMSFAGNRRNPNCPIVIEDHSVAFGWWWGEYTPSYFDLYPANFRVLDMSFYNCDTELVFDSDFTIECTNLSITTKASYVYITNIATKSVTFRILGALTISGVNEDSKSIIIYGASASKPVIFTKAGSRVYASGTSLQNSTANGGATFNAILSSNNEDAGGNVGWNFTPDWFLNIKKSSADPVAMDNGNFAVQGRIVSKAIQMALFTTNENAVRAGSEQLRRESYPFAQISFPANRHAFRYDPGDVFRFSYAEYGISNMVCRVVQIQEEGPESEVINITVIEDVYAVALAITEYSGPTNYAKPQETYPVTPFTKQKIIEAPYVVTQDDSVQMLPIAARENTPDLGFGIYMSMDNGASYVPVIRSDTLYPHGKLDASYPESALLIDDEGIVVNLDNEDDIGVIESETFTNALAGANVALLGDEIICFQNIEPITETQYRISGIIRARYGTDRAAHPRHTSIFFFGSNLPTPFSHQETAAGSIRYFKFVPDNIKNTAEISDCIQMMLILEGKAATPYKPVNLTANGNGFAARYDDDIVLAWSPRKRGSGAGLGSPGIILADAAHEGLFTVEVYVDDLLVRTVDAIDAATWTYTEAMNLEDNTSLAASIQFLLYNYIGAYVSQAVELIVKKN